MRYTRAALVPLGLLLSTLLFAQPWAGIIDPARAIDWSGAGVVGGIPNRTTICSTLNPGATAAQINSALSSCPDGQVVKLSAGSYTLSAGLTFGNKSNVTLRGDGPDKTLLKFTGNVNCRGFSASICIGSGSNPVMPSPSSTTSWTGGYAKGSTSLTFASTAGISSGSILVLDQLDDSSDPGTVYICAGSACAGEGGNAYGRSGRAQQQLVRVKSVAGSTVTIEPPLYMPNWRSSQTPGASFSSPGLTGDGIEDLSMDHGGNGAMSGVVMLYTNNCWMKDVRSLTSNRNHVWLYQSLQNTIRDSYFYGTQNHASQSYGIEFFSTSNMLVENNIFQHIAGPTTINGSDSASVIAYNYATDNYYTPSSNWLIPAFIAHESGIAFELVEGNDGQAFEGDDIHGTHHFMTAFRNNLYGDTRMTANTEVIKLWAYSRYFNVIGNVLGRSTYYNVYEVNLGTNSKAVYSFGAGGGAPNNPSNDPNVQKSLMRWGNYDTVTATSRFVSSEVPSGLSIYSNPVPSSQVLPASFYLTAKPKWWGTTFWPAIGPEVVGGSDGGGHAYHIPARLCYETSPKDANGVLTFSADACYASASPTNPAPPTGLGAVTR